jgi:hypothetical protein
MRAAGGFDKDVQKKSAWKACALFFMRSMRRVSGASRQMFQALPLKFLLNGVSHRLLKKPVAL